VALVAWHPARQLGGMCHYMLPHRCGEVSAGLDGRYADEAAALLFDAMRRAGTQPADYQIRLFGGANMFHPAGDEPLSQVGQRNVAAARAIVARHGLICTGEHLAGAGHRNVIFEVWSGRVWLKHEPLRIPAEMPVTADDRSAWAA
jgi:chemotaxis protein CheD